MRKTYIIAKSLIITACVILFASCNSKDYFYEQDKAPNLMWTTTGDSVLLTGFVKVDQEASFNFNLSDPEQNGNGIFLIDKVGDFDFEFGDNEFFITTHNVDSCKGTIVATDIYGKETKIRFIITSFTNKKPVAKCKVSLVGNLDSREVLIDMSEAYDEDSNFGGHIVQYEYTITNSNGEVYKVVNELKKMGYIFDCDGLQKIEFRVCDDNGEWSEAGTTFIEINSNK